MKVVVAESAGFCYGVRRALDTVLQAANSSGKRMFTLGPLIHNPQVIEWLAERGVKSAATLADVPPGSTLIMPSHGVPADVMARAKDLGLEVIDATCPFVAKVHRAVSDLQALGYQVVVLGDSGHTEVRGIMSVAGDDAVAVQSAEAVDVGALRSRVGIVSQTTETLESYRRLVSVVAAQVYEVRAFNTICKATSERQKAAVDVAAQVDVMVVVGGRNSANTRRLAEVCLEAGAPTHHVEVAGEIDESWFEGMSSVGVTAGASTPDWLIEEVVGRLKSIGE